LVIQLDSREQKYEHVTKYFDSQGIKWVRSKCIVGDYINLENPMVVIDRKKDLQEVAGNVCQQHERFVREMELAKELGYKMIVLVEEPNITKLTDVCSWFNWRKKKNPRAVSGKTLYKIMLTMSQKYGFEWQFCKKADCGKRIIELLGGEVNARSN
jgi:ERCC4-type nuclease